MEKQTRMNQSSEKLLRIIELLADKREPMRLFEIASALEMNNSTALRFVGTLEKCGYVAQDKTTLKYNLTFKICSVANKLDVRSSLSEIAKPYMKEISRIFGESVCLSIAQDSQVVYIEAVDAPGQMLKAMQRIGNIAPMHCTGAGKLFLSRMTEAEIDGVIAQKGLERFTNNTITTKKDLIFELERVREKGYAYDDEECEIGAKCVAVPLASFESGVAACISVTGPAQRLTGDLISRNLDYLLSACKKISAELGA